MYSGIEGSQCGLSLTCLAGLSCINGTCQNVTIGTAPCGLFNECGLGTSCDCVNNEKLCLPDPNVANFPLECSNLFYVNFFQTPSS